MSTGAADVLPTDASRPEVHAKARQRTEGRRGRAVKETAWFLGSIALFVLLWEFIWWTGAVNVLIFPPPHVFIGDFWNQSKFFRTGDAGAGPGLQPVISATMATLARVLCGLALGFIGSLLVAVMVTQSLVMRRLLLPLVTLLAPISPMAWLPVSIIILGVGNGPALFMVFIGVFFMMTLSTIGDINNVGDTYHNVARTLGATKRQTLFLVILPAIMPGMMRSLRLNLFGAWMMVLIAEAVGVGSGLGQVVLLARNTFNSNLVFLTMMIIGVAGFSVDLLFRTIERRVLWWDAVANRGAAK